MSIDRSTVNQPKHNNKDLKIKEISHLEYVRPNNDVSLLFRLIKKEFKGKSRVLSPLWTELERKNHRWKFKLNLHLNVMLGFIFKCTI